MCGNQQTRQTRGRSQDSVVPSFLGKDRGRKVEESEGQIAKSSFHSVTLRPLTPPPHPLSPMEAVWWSECLAAPDLAALPANDCLPGCLADLTGCRKIYPPPCRRSHRASPVVRMSKKGYDSRLWIHLPCPPHATRRTTPLFHLYITRWMELGSCRLVSSIF